MYQLSMIVTYSKLINLYSRFQGGYYISTYFIGIELHKSHCVFTIVLGSLIPTSHDSQTVLNLTFFNNT